MKKLLVISLILFLVGCGSKDKVDILKNYAAVWQLDTEDYDHFKNLLPAQSEKLMNYYDKGLIENIYFQKGEETGETYSVGGISFVVKAKDEDGAETILDAMPFAQSKIAKYQLYPLGVKWLTRTQVHTNVAADAKQSFVVVWISTGTKEEMMEHAEAQAKETMSLYKSGVIENAYLSPEVIEGSKSGYPIIYFINAKDVKSAKAILDNTVYPKLGLAKYELRPVGNFWLGNVADKE